MILSNDWTVYSQATEISDERKCLDHMLQHQIRVEADGKTVSRTIGELIEIAAKIKHDFDISPPAAQSVLARHGFKVPDNERVVLISNTAKAIKAIAVLGGPRCCKRDTFTALLQAERFLGRYFEMDIGDAHLPVCSFYSSNQECIKRDCPFFPSSKKETK